MFQIAFKTLPCWVNYLLVSSFCTYWSEKHFHYGHNVMSIIKRGFFSFFCWTKARSLCKLESFSSLKGLKPGCCDVSLLLQITSTKAACHRHYVTDMLWTLHYGYTNCMKWNKVKTVFRSVCSGSCYKGPNENEGDQ